MSTTEKLNPNSKSNRNFDFVTNLIENHAEKSNRNVDFVTNFIENHAEKSNRNVDFCDQSNSKSKPFYIQTLIIHKRLSHKKNLMVAIY